MLSFVLVPKEFKQLYYVYFYKSTQIAFIHRRLLPIKINTMYTLNESMLSNERIKE